MHKAVAGLLSTSLLFLLSGPAGAGLDDVATLIEAQRYQQALEQLSQRTDSRRSRLLQANALSGLKRSDEAEALYRALIDEAPQDPTPYNNLASLYAASGRLQEASELLTQAMKSDARYAAIYKNLSRVYVEMSRNSYARALRMNEQQQGLRLLTLDHRDGPAVPLQVAALAEPQPAATPPPQSAQPQSRASQQSATSVDEAPAPSRDQFDAGGAIVALKQWAAAWSAQDVEAYLGAYDAEFLPPRDLSLSQWQTERRVRLKRPKKIEVALSDFEVSSTGSSSLTVKLVQRYRSDSYRDISRKGFILVLRDGEWKIGDEYTIEVMN
jgi:tetratricopeptide (TPR) repeat protein